MFSTSLPSLVLINFVSDHDILYGLISWHSIVILGVNISTILNEYAKDVFVDWVPLKSILFFFHSESTCHRIAEMALTCLPLPTTAKGRFKKLEFVERPLGTPLPPYKLNWNRSLQKSILLSSYTSREKQQQNRVGGLFDVTFK